jgi:hypothetical protein
MRDGRLGEQGGMEGKEVVGSARSRRGAPTHIRHLLGDVIERGSHPQLEVPPRGPLTRCRYTLTPPLVFFFLTQDELLSLAAPQQCLLRTDRSDWADLLDPPSALPPDSTAALLLPLLLPKEMDLNCEFHIKECASEHDPQVCDENGARFDAPQHPNLSNSFHPEI